MSKFSFQKTAKVVASVGLASAVLLPLWLLCRSTSVVHATPPIEENPVSIGNASEIVATSSGSRALAVADLDRNGTSDLALADGSRIRIVANTGLTTPVWSLSTTVGSMSANLVDLATVDLDRDGRIDLVAAATDAAGNSQLVLWQSSIAGAGSFTAAWAVSNTLTSTARITLTTLAVGDLDRDGAPDVVAAGHDGMIRLWRNPLTGTQPFTTAWGTTSVIGVSGRRINQVALADVDRDGRLDIVAVTGGNNPIARVWQNPFSGTRPFTASWSVYNTLSTLGSDGLSVAVADFDRNGAPDVAAGDTAGGVMAWSNPLTGTLPFTMSWGSPGSVGNAGAPVGSLVAVDLDNDGQPDLAGGTEVAPSTVLAWHNPGTPFGGTWPAVVAGTRDDTTYDLVVADVESDGDVDVMSGEGDPGPGHVILWPNLLVHRDAAFDGTSAAIGAVGHCDGFLIGDLDRDGLPDIVTQDQVGSLVIFENDGSPFISAWPQHVIGLYVGLRPLALTDINRDGKLDVIVGNNGTPARLEVWYTTGSPFDAASWHQQTIGNLPAVARAVDVGDLDGNGRLEIVAGSGTGVITPTSSTNAVWVWRYTGSSPFSSSWISAAIGVVTYTIGDLKLADLNNDARLDVVFGTWCAPEVGSSSDPRPQSEWTDAYQLRAFRNDGAPFSGGWTAFDLGRDPATRTLQLVYHGYFGASIYSVDTADFDNDGNLDIVTGDDIVGDFQVMVWQNDGTPFDGQLWVPSTVGLGPWWETQGDPWLSATVNSVVAVDLNADGLVDVVSGSDSPESYEVIYWENTGIPFSEWMTDTHWIRHDLGVTNHNGTVVAIADLDNDGDEDVASLFASWDPVDAIQLWQNQGGSVGQVAVATAPATVLYGTTNELMRVPVSHHGKATDHSVELEEWRLIFQDGAGTPLTSAQANMLFANLVIYRDTNGDGVWQIGDTPVVTVSNPALSGGVQTFLFPAGDSRAAISATQTVTYFVVASLEPTASQGAPTAFRMLFDPDAASVVRDRVNGASLSINDTQPVTIGPVTVAYAPVAGLAVTDSSPTPLGLPTTLTATITAGTNVSYTWAFGDGATASGAVVVHTYPAINRYTAIVTASNLVSIATATATVQITDASIAGLVATNNSPTPLGQATTLTGTVAAGTRVNYAWAFGDGATAGGAVVTHTYPVGVYTAVVTASNSANAVTATTAVTVEEPIAELAATNDSPKQVGQAATLTATVKSGTHVVYTWAFAGGDTASGAVVTHTYSIAGVYTAAVTARNSVSVRTATTTLTFTPGSLQHVEVSPSTAMLMPSAKQLFTAAGYDQYDNEINGLTFTWAVVNGGGTIDSNGLFTAGYAEGMYSDTVRATVGDIHGYASVTIQEKYFIFLPLVTRLY